MLSPSVRNDMNNNNNDDDKEMRERLSGLLDLYLTLDQVEEQVETEEEELIPTPSICTPISYPPTALGPAATTAAQLFSSLVDEEITNTLIEEQRSSISETKKIRSRLKCANEQLQAKYPAFHADIDRCLDLLNKIQMDRAIIDASIERSKAALRKANH